MVGEQSGGALTDKILFVQILKAAAWGTSPPSPPVPGETKKLLQQIYEAT